MAQTTEGNQTLGEPDKLALPPPRKRRRPRARVTVIGILCLLALIGGTYYYLKFIAPYESTDDAFIDGYVAAISARVPGQVVRLLVGDNRLVRAGDVLLQLDPRDYEASLAQARAELASARSQQAQALDQLSVSQARVGEAQATEAAEQADAERAANDLRRYQSVEARAVSKTVFDQISTQARSRAAALRAAQSQLVEARAGVTLSRAAADSAAAAVNIAEARLTQAQLNLSYTTVISPVDGRVTARTVDSGNYVQPGQQLLAIAPTSVWVTANFKETQLAHMRPGQPVEIRVDAYPDLRLRGHVDSLQAGSGARFSLLPPENAVGNYVKVVQRVPVKIDLDRPLPSGLDVAPGMSVEPTVRVQ